MKYYRTTLKTDIQITGIYSIHYFEYSKDFSFSGETHDFWEFVYVDKGAIHIQADETLHTLTKGEIVFHRPNEFHALKADGKLAPNLVIISFESKSKALFWFEKRVCRIANEQKNLLARILQEAKNAFSSDFSNPMLPELERKDNQLFGSEQLLRNYLTEFLIGVFRTTEHLTNSQKIAAPVKEISRDQAFKAVVQYFHDHIAEIPDYHTLCHETGFSSTYLQNVFKEKTGRSVMEYAKLVRIEHVKEAIREGKHTFSQISEQLGFSSLPYLSRLFKQRTGMTMSEYASSVKLNF